ncbi:MAG: Uncharacterized protein G01um10145_923 [Microgenomates group bacterium Gr01-1014_5]|nr:MAG: Uncharacterized protein G01um10145_923 [Microgenomates group bacterium Gr01-1014_5]
MEIYHKTWYYELLIGMLNNIKRKINRTFTSNPSAFVIVLFVLILSVSNFTPGTYLTGWDTLHPEFDLLLNLKRVFYGVWREEQGLGALAVHAHMSELPRIIFYGITSLFAPENLQRYLYFFLALLVGPLGVYFFLKELVYASASNVKKEVASFAGGLFYLLNLGTLQHFFFPFEMFAALYAFLPWLLLLAAKYLHQGFWKHLVWFAGLTILALPMAYAATLWYVYFAVLAVYCLTKVTNLRRVSLILGTTLILNSYWLLPQAYLVATSSGQVSEAKINQMFSDKAFAHDKDYATLDNAVFLKGFLFDWQKFTKGNYKDALEDWKKHADNFFVFETGLVISLIVLTGFIFSLRHRNNFGYKLLPVFILTFPFLIYGHEPLSSAVNFLRDTIPLFREGYRFPWTKFSLIVIFCFAFYFSQGVFWISGFLQSTVKKLVLAALVSLILAVWMWPAIGGNFISRQMRLTIPQEYFQLQNWFENQPQNTRLAVFPIPTFFGWEYYQWGFEGAGFAWFGMEQSVLTRDFDRWSSFNENYYWEASYALYTKNNQLFEKVLDKYQVNWLVVDENIINPPSSKALYLDELKNMLSTEKFTLEGEFGKVKVYKVGLQTPVSNYVFLANNLPSVVPETKWNNNDRGYLDNGNYLSITGDSFYYPFRSLFTNKTQEDLEFTVEDLGDSYLFRKTVPTAMSDWKLALPDLGLIELVWIDPNNMTKSQVIVPDITFNGREVLVKFPKIAGLFGYEINLVTDKASKRAKNCNTARGLVKNQIIKEEDGLAKRLIAKDANNCSAAYYLEKLPHGTGYLVGVESRNVKGKSLMFWIENSNTRKSDLETYLPDKKGWQTSYFVQPPMEKDGAGYALHFDNISIGADQTINDLRKVSIYSFPYKLLTSMYLHPKDLVLPQQEISTVETEHKTPDMYRVTLATPSTGTLVLSQAYHDGWKAYEGDFQYLAPILGREIKEHVKVNNWENGWQLPDNTTKVTILFLPQYLQFLGYFLAIGSIIALLVPSVRRRLT